MQQRIDRDSMVREILEGQINTVAGGVFGDIAEDVGELESDSGFFGELLRAQIFVTEDANANQADYRCDEVAVSIEIAKGLVGLGRAVCGVVKVEGDAGHELVEKRKRNGEAAGCVAHGEEDGIDGCRALR